VIAAIIQGAAIAFILAESAYHRWTESKRVEKKLPQEASIPRCDEGAPYPLIFGRVRVRAPIIVWTGASTFDFLDDGYWRLNMILVVGITMNDGSSTSRLHKVWIGDLGKAFFLNADGSPDPDPEVLIKIEEPASERFGPFCTYYDGNPSQDPGAGELGEMQTTEGVDIFQIPARVGKLTICLGKAGGGLTRHWSIGPTQAMAAHSFEASSYVSSSSYPARGADAQIGYDVNPVNILWDLLVAKLGKLGIPATYLDSASFAAAGTTLKSESFGLSFSFEESRSADELIQEILRHIDGAIDEDTATGKLVLTLVRPVDPAAIPHITRSNCDKLTNFVMAGWTGLPSSLRLIWTNRNKDYNDDTIVLHSQGNAVNQGETEELLVEMRGITELALAVKVADREAQARLRPIIKFRVLVGREFLRVVRGQAVKVTWSGPDLSGVVMRVADVNRGTIEDGKISLDLISDYHYSARGQVQVPLIDRLSDHLDDLEGADVIG
jgi:hypothetical protein